MEQHLSTQLRHVDGWRRCKHWRTLELLWTARMEWVMHCLDVSALFYSETTNILFSTSTLLKTLEGLELHCSHFFSVVFPFNFGLFFFSFVSKICHSPNEMIYIMYKCTAKHQFCAQRLEYDFVVNSHDTLDFTNHHCYLLFNNNSSDCNNYNNSLSLCSNTIRLLYLPISISYQQFTYQRVRVALVPTSVISNLLCTL